MPGPVPSPGSASPFGCATVADAVERTAALWPTHGFTFQGAAGDERRYTFPEIERASAARAAALQQLGLQKGDRLALVIVEPEDFVLTFFAAIRIGVIAVPIYPPQPPGDLSAYAERTSRILHAASAAIAVGSASALPILRALGGAAPLRHVVAAERLREATGTPSLPPIAPDDIAFLQFTSGSTSDPRGVMVTHACLLANAAGIVGPHGLRGDPARDIGVSWLPLYHDMGLVGFVVVPMITGIPVVFIPTARFLRNPLVWMDTMHRHRATISYGPNFSYALATRLATPERLAKWDLSCVKALGCGGEPVHAGVIRAFNDVFHQHAGLPADVVRPGYGLAEATLSTALTPIEHGMRTLRVDRERFEQHGVARACGAPEGDARDDAIEHVSAGRVIPDHEVIIAREDGTACPDGHQGEVWLRGPSVTPGYFNNPPATSTAFRDGMLRTGDLGYVHDGYLYITGRTKDLIIYNGRNIHPQSIEWIAERVDGTRQGNVVAVSVPGADTERILVLMETRESSHDALISRVKRAVHRELSLPVDVVCLRRGELPKTSSGKVQRHLTRQRYLEHALGRASV